MVESEGWQAARLIPTSGINGQDEAERRATSALLAVIQAVREFRMSILRPLGAPTGNLESFVEVPFTLGDDRAVCPDGLLLVTRGKTSWVSLVEVKTGAGVLERAQVESYLDAAREQGFASVLTISNQMAPAPGLHPVSVDKRKLRKVQLHHLSWAEILTAAVQTRVHRGVADPDQAWILGELIRYLEHPRSGALDFADMGAAWVQVRDAAVSGTLRSSDKGVEEVASRWDQLLRFAALRLGRELGADVQVVIGRREAADPSLRLGKFVTELVDFGTLSGVVRIPDAIADLSICCDLRAGTVSVSAEVPAPREGRPLTRVNWLLRQLTDAPSQLRIDGLLAGTRSSTSELLRVVRDDPSQLVDPQRRDFRAFRVTASSGLGTKRGTGRGSFIDSVLAAIDGFYEDVLQALRPWRAKAPQLPRSGRSAVEDAGIDTDPPRSDLSDEPRDLNETNSARESEDPEGNDSAEGSAASDSARSGVEGTPADGSTPIAAEPDEHVEWGRATERLERERAHANPFRS